MTSGFLLSVVVPLYDEADNLGPLLEALSRVLAGVADEREILLVDDGSADATWSRIEAACSHDTSITGLRLSRNFGKEAAVCAGLERARGDAVLLMDGDLQHPPELIPHMVALWRAGTADVVEGVKSDRQGQPAGANLGASLFYALFGRLSGFELTDASDFKLMDRRVVDAWRQMPERNLFFRGMSAWLGFRRVQIPFEVPQRATGRTRWPAWRLVRLALTAITSFSSAPLQLVTLTGVGFALFALGLGVQTLWMKWYGHAVDGFTTVIILQLLTGGLILLGLGIIGEYLARIYDETKRRPRYLVREVAQGAARLGAAQAFPGIEAARGCDVETAGSIPREP